LVKHSAILQSPVDERACNLMMCIDASIGKLYQPGVLPFTADRSGGDRRGITAALPRLRRNRR
jgi:hypothetical protein